MDENNKKSDYLFLLRNTDWGHDMPLDQAQAALESMLAWVEEMRTRGVFVAGQPLSPPGKVVSGAAADTSEGPYAESKEIVGGFIIVRTATIGEAEKEARACPVLRLGMTIEVRPLLANCPLGDEIGVQMLVAPL